MLTTNSFENLDDGGEEKTIEYVALRDERTFTTTPIVFRACPDLAKRDWAQRNKAKKSRGKIALKMLVDEYSVAGLTQCRVRGRNRHKGNSDPAIRCFFCGSGVQRVLVPKDGETGEDFTTRDFRRPDEKEFVQHLFWDHDEIARGVKVKELVAELTEEGNNNIGAVFRRALSGG